MTSQGKPHHQKEQKNDKKITRIKQTNKQTNVREAHRPAPSSPSEMITMLKGMTKHEDKEHGRLQNMKRP